MTYQKVCNIIASELKEYHPKRVKISLSHLRSLFQETQIKEIAVENYCCFGDERCCWIDIEGPSCGWLFANHKPSEMPQVLFKYVKGHMRQYMDILYKRKAFTYNTDGYLYYVIPMRDIARYDIYICFQLVGDKSEQIFLWLLQFAGFLELTRGLRLERKIKVVLCKGKG